MKRFPLDLFDRYDVANPSAAVPAALLSPDGRYSCDGCEALTERGALAACQAGYFCSGCAPSHAAPPARPMQADDVEFVEVIETASGALVVAVFDEEAELLGLFEGFEHRIRIAQDVRAVLQCPADGVPQDWPAPCAKPQATYDRLTARATAYSVIGRWSRGAGLDLRELRLSRLLGRGPRNILASPLAA
jgi:hypothetical protein